MLRHVGSESRGQIVVCGPGDYARLIGAEHRSRHPGPAMVISRRSMSIGAIGRGVSSPAATCTPEGRDRPHAEQRPRADTPAVLQ